MLEQEPVELLALAIVCERGHSLAQDRVEEVPVRVEVHRRLSWHNRRLRRSRGLEQRGLVEVELVVVHHARVAARHARRRADRVVDDVRPILHLLEDRRGLVDEVDLEADVVGDLVRVP